MRTTISAHCTWKSVLDTFTKSAAQKQTLPSFLIPAFRSIELQKSSFSTTSSVSARKDGNKRRGMSALHKTGISKRIKLTVKLKDLPKPVLDPAKRTQIVTDEDHGLWQFFNEERAALIPNDEIKSHGRAWVASELRKKSFDDLWKLYWVCIKEVNRVLTNERERARLEAGHGESESLDRVATVRKSMRAIKLVLTERWYQFEHARKLAQDDEDIDLNANTTAGETGYALAPVKEADVDDDDLLFPKPQDLNKIPASQQAPAEAPAAEAPAAEAPAAEAPAAEAPAAQVLRSRTRRRSRSRAQN